MGFTAYYDKIYLVALHEDRNSSHRVTEREGGVRPGTVSFTGHYLMPDGETSYSTLVLDEATWSSWFKGRKMLPGFEDYESAAANIVKRCVHVYYGCPLCSIRFKKYEDAKEHIHKHINKFINQFRIELEEDDNGKN